MLRGTDSTMQSVLARATEAAQEGLSALSYHSHRILEEVENETGENEFNAVVFWSVNAIWITVLIAVVIWFWKFNGAERMVAWTRNAASSDRALAQRMRRQREAEAESRKRCPEKHRATLRKRFRAAKVHMIVTEADFVKEASLPFVDEKFDLEESSQSSSNGYLQLATETGDRSVPNCCAVCLGSYSVGDSVVWSTTRTCQHAFHEECVTDWLVKMQGDHPCPCCRQVFIDGVSQKKDKAISWAAEQSMNLSAISL